MCGASTVCECTTTAALRTPSRALWYHSTCGYRVQRNMSMKFVTYSRQVNTAKTHSAPASGKTTPRLISFIAYRRKIRLPSRVLPAENPIPATGYRSARYRRARSDSSLKYRTLPYTIQFSAVACCRSTSSVGSLKFQTTNDSRQSTHLSF